MTAAVGGTDAQKAYTLPRRASGDGPRRNPPAAGGKPGARDNRQGVEPMKNITMKTDGNILTITVDLSKTHGASKSGKTIIIASTEGNQKVSTGPAIIGLNVYKPC